MNGIQGFKRRKAALAGILLLILLTAGLAASCGSGDREAGKSASGEGGKAQAGYTCSLTIKCDTALKSEKLDEGKKKLLPADGVLLEEAEVEFQKGETVYDILQRETRERKLQMESAEGAVYKTQYIEGIGNLYELDCGELSGWMYKVGDTFPKTGCSQYEVEPGDHIQWLYSCDQGKDIGGSNY